MKVLIFTPTYGAGPLPETLASVAAQRFAGRVRAHVSWHNPYGSGDMRNVLAQMAHGREMALRGDYDAMLVVEHDMRIPPDALQRLWDTGGAVAYGVYLFRHGEPVLNVLAAYPGSRNVGESLGLKRRELAIARARGVVECTGLGFGCTLIRPEALEAVRFRDLERPGCVDMAFATDCLRAGIRQVADMRVMCGHWAPSTVAMSTPLGVGNANSTTAGEWLMPFDGGHSLAVEALQDVTVRGGAYTRRLEAGNSYSLPDTEARDLARAGYVRLMEGSA